MESMKYIKNNWKGVGRQIKKEEGVIKAVQKGISVMYC